MAWFSSAVVAFAAMPTHAGETAHWLEQGPEHPSLETTAAAARIEHEPVASDLSVGAPSQLRKWGSFGGVAGIYASATTYMYFAWYHGQPNLPSFKFGGDGYFGAGTYAGGSDKLGHAWASLALSRVTSEILVWGGWMPWKAGLIASGMTLGLLTVFEVKDAFYACSSDAL